VIVEFCVQNHRSFRGEQTLSLAAGNYDKSLPENLITPDLPGLPDLRLIKAVALYGPNAGGKTNVLKALQFLQWLVLESATGQKPEAKLPVEPFRLDHESVGKPTLLELTFIAENVRYELAVAVTGERVVQERLVAYPSGRAQVWYDRVWNEETKQYDWSPEKPTDFERDDGIVGKTRDNALFLSTAAQWASKQVTPVYAWFAKKLKFLNLSADAALSFSHLTQDITAQIVNGSDGAHKYISSLLRSADLGLTNVDAKEPEIPDFMDWQVTFQHAGKEGGRFTMDWPDESAGTRRFFSVLGPWLELLVQDRVLCVDEIETSLHPMLVAELLRLLLKSTNVCPQLLFTTHNPLLLDMTLLRRDQVWFADKNQEGESFLYPLTDYKPRADESLVRGYLSGRYGAVPFIPHGLVGGPAAEAGAAEVKHAG
jgi:hypothetical protein